MGPRIVILADDLSGAADCAAACHRAGLDTKVCLQPQAHLKLKTLGEPAEAMALDLDSRAAPPEEARARTLAVTRDGGALYRKIDSTLRGHVALEIAATLEIAGEGAFAVVCPAYPATGRAVVGGQVLVDGQRLEDTEIWKRGGSGPTDLMILLAELKPVAAGLGVLRSGGLTAAIETARASGARAVVCDAETEADMEAIVAGTIDLPGVVWAGSGGLTIPLARALVPGGKPAPQLVVRRHGPTLVVVGSASSVSRRQLALLAKDPRVQTLLVPPSVLLEGPEGRGWRPASRAIVAAVGKAGKDTVAVAIDPKAPVEPGVGHALAENLGLLTGRQLGRFGALLATGGETARAVLSAAGVEALAIRRELEPGVVLSACGSLPVVTKAGAFGRPESVVDAVEILRRLPLA